MKRLRLRKDEQTDYNTKLLLLRPSDVASNFEERPSQKAHNDSLMGAIGPALIIARVFGILPIPTSYSEGKGKDFQWRSFRTIYSLLILISILAEALLSITRLAVIGVSFQGSVNAVFFCNNLAAVCIFLRLATSWKTITHCWNYVEQNVMGSYGWPNKLGRKTLFMTIFMLMGGIVEFSLSMASTMAGIWPCAKRHGISAILREFFLIKFAMTFYVTKYAIWKGVILFLIQIVATFTWNFVDLILILISMTLSARFRMLNDLIFCYERQENRHEFWRRIRETYFVLSELTRVTDRSLGSLVLLSFVGNFYFICLQLMHSVRTQNSSVYYEVYSVYSVVFLALRTYLVGIMGASIYEESKRPKEILYGVPTENYCVEVDRFLKQVCADEIAITGRNFFAITRSVLLTVAGTVVTYEIILVQFNPATDPDDDTALMSGNGSFSAVSSCTI